MGSEEQLWHAELCFGWCFLRQNCSEGSKFNPFALCIGNSAAVFPGAQSCQKAEETG